MFLLGYRSGVPGLATNYVDPILKLQAQDEAIYAASSIHIAAQGGWLTPMFMGRFALYKPPLFYWLSAVSAKIGGVSEAALRAPSVLAGALVLTLFFALVLIQRGWAAATCVVLLLAGDHNFHTLARTATTDALLLLWIALAITVLVRDPTLQARSSPALFGAAVGLAIMTKAAAGILPVIVLVLGFAVAQPPLRRMLTALIVAAAVALPWHLYQLAVHTRWFWDEYILTEHLALGLSAPQTSDESQAWFYLRRLWLTDPVLCSAFLFAIPRLWRGGLPCRITIAWIAGAALTLFTFQYRAAWYLLPLIAPLALATAQSLPWPRVFVPLLAITFIVKLALPSAPLGLSYDPQSVIASAHMLEQECRAGRPNPLFLIDAQDQFYAAALAIPELHYVFTTPGVSAQHGAIDFGYLGIAVTADEFRRLPELRPMYARRLREWGLESDDAIASVILAPGGFTPPPRDDSRVPNRRPIQGWCGSQP